MSVSLGRLLRFHATLLVLLCLLASVGLAQTDTAPPPVEAWKALAQEAQDEVAKGDASIDVLDSLSAKLAEQRSDTQLLVEAAQARVTELRDQLDALGPPPENGETEASEVASKRADLRDELQTAQVPLLQAQDMNDLTEAALKAVDTQIRTRISRELLSLGPSPLMPGAIGTSLVDVTTYLDGVWNEVKSGLGSSITRDRILSRLPVAVLLALVGLVMIFGLYRRQMAWMRGVAERAEQRDTQPPPWLGTLLITGRLLTPIVGATLLISGLSSLELFGPKSETIIQALPAAVGTVIWAYWISHSLFAPVLSGYRLVRMDDAAATACARMGTWLGVIVGLHIVLSAVFTQAQTSAGTIAVLSLPLVVFGALILWRLGARLQPSLDWQAEFGADGEPTTTEPFGLGILRLFRRFVVVIALVSPVLAVIGYSQAAQFLLFGTIRSLGVLGAAFVIYVALQHLIDGYLGRRSEGGTETGTGLLPVFLGFLITCMTLPLLALIWGARRSDLLTVWVWMRDGVSIGGARISLSDFLLLAVVFGIGYAITRFIQSLLRGTVLPRTRLDVGGRNAVVTGVGYLGIFLSALLAITATGIDLSGLAIVAGALSVGVGFGLQTIVSNFVSGIILLVERPIKQGDWIEVGGFSGYVTKISVRSTAIDTFDRATVIVPNQDLIAGTVLNRTHGSLWGRVIVPVGVAYGTDPEKIRDILLEIANDHALVLRRPEPSVLFMNFGADSLDFEIRAYLRDVNNMMNVRSDMNFAIARRFAEEGIEIPFAQRDIHLRNPEALVELLKGTPPRQEGE